MDRDEFKLLLLKATFKSYGFAQKYVSNVLPANFLYLININEPYEELQEDEETFPELKMKYGKYSKPITNEAVLDRLLIKQKIPVWIDIAVFKSDEIYTYLTLDCCNRFSAKNEMYYYRKSDTGPFGIKSPIFPPGWDEEKGKFDLDIRQNLLSNSSIFRQITNKIFG